ncbi:cytochrome P450 4B1-like [Gopherus evgoodei]|uniref:cytochrome P450 4B1-like n=1 Tax=Gopherus evgoodei TaxID=1825980 RepID=UPI0011D02074|nr:cytochrome P450 4B1-like [Gopherus evgoodei]
MTSVVVRLITAIWCWLKKDVFRIVYLLTVLCLTYMVLKAIKLYQWRRKLNKALQSFPGPPVHWLFGNVHEFSRRGKDLDKLLEWSKKYARAFPVWFGKFVVFVSLNDADYAKAVCARGDPKDNIFYRYVLPWIGKGLLTLQGPKWFQHRKLLTPGFHYGVLKPYVSLITKSTQVMLDKWEHLITQEKSVELFGHVSLMTLDSILKCAFSHESNCQMDRENSYIKSVYEITYQINYRIWYLPYQIDFIYWLSRDGRRFQKACEMVHLQTDKVIKERKKSLKDERELEKIQKKRHLDFLDILLCAKDEKGDGLSDEDIRAEVDTFMFGGHDTTASGICWTLYCLAMYPEHQQKCREEIRELLGDRETIQWDDLGKMPNTTMCIKESMRIFPPVPFVGRQLSKPITFHDGRYLPEGTLVGINIYLIHRDPSLWKDPEVFDPMRFSPENSSKRHSHAFMPFSAGARNCIGQQFAMIEMKVAIALSLLRFEFSLNPAKIPRKIPQMVLQSKNGIHVHLKKIHWH